MGFVSQFFYLRIPLPYKGMIRCAEQLLRRQIYNKNIKSHTFHTLLAYRFSPSHTSSHSLKWIVEVGDEVDCYNPIYTIQGKNVTIFDDGDDTEMIVETCEPGIISYLLDPSKIPSLEPETPIGILSEDTEEHNTIVNLIDQQRPDLEDPDPLKTILTNLEKNQDIVHEVRFASHGMVVSSFVVC